LNEIVGGSGTEKEIRGIGMNVFSMRNFENLGEDEFLELLGASYRVSDYSSFDEFAEGEEE
jgi:hypothetical protein